MNVQNKIAYFKFGNEFKSFLYSVGVADVTFEVNHYSVKGKPQLKAETLFNLDNTVKAYASRLRQEYDFTCIEIQESLDAFTSTNGKAYALSKYIAEIKSMQQLLTYTEEYGYKHQNYKFRNLSKDRKYLDITYEQKVFQNYFKLMDRYLRKMYDFLSCIESSIPKISQSELSNPQSTLSDSNSSTIEDPISFFDFLLTKNGIESLRNDFIPKQKPEHFHDVEYDKETETKVDSEYDPDKDDYVFTTIKFQDELYKRCESEFIISKELIDNKVLKAKCLEEKLSLLETLIGKANYFKKVIAGDTNVHKYPKVQKYPDDIIQYINKKYSPFCHQLTLNSEDPKQNIPKQRPLTPSELTFTYTHFKEKSASLDGLWEDLKEKEFINKKTQKLLFRPVFTGSEVNNPITWVGTWEELVYFIKQLRKKPSKISIINNRHWEIACHCFKPSKKSEHYPKFDWKKCRSQQKPTLERRKEIEIIVSRL